MIPAFSGAFSGAFNSGGMPPPPPEDPNFPGGRIDHKDWARRRKSVEDRIREEQAQEVLALRKELGIDKPEAAQEVKLITAPLPVAAPTRRVPTAEERAAKAMARMEEKRAREEEILLSLIL